MGSSINYVDLFFWGIFNPTSFVGHFTKVHKILEVQYIIILYASLQILIVVECSSIASFPLKIHKL